MNGHPGIPALHAVHEGGVVLVLDEDVQDQGRALVDMDIVGRGEVT